MSEAAIDTQLEEHEKNMASREWRLNNLYFIKDKRGKKIQFNLNWAQKQLMHNMWFMMLILKGRQFGITTFYCILYLDCCLFNSNVSAGIIAHDQKSQTEIFETKIRYAWENLDPSLRAVLKGRNDSSHKLTFENGSSIQVTLGRSGTMQFLHVSEFGKLCAQNPSRAREVVTGAFEAVAAGQYITVESTAEGRGGYFHDYVMQALKSIAEDRAQLTTQFKFFFLEWWRHPDYTHSQFELVPISKDQREHFERLEAEEDIYLTDGQKAWYAEKWRSLGEDIFREYPSTVEEAFRASIRGSYLKKQMTFIRQHGMITVVPHQPGVPVNTGWDLGVGDEMVIVLHQQVAMQNRIIGVIHENGEGLDYFVNEMQKTGYVWGRHYIPHDGDHRRLGVQVETVQQMLEGLGLTNVEVVEQIRQKSTAIEITRAWLPTCWIEATECEWLINCLDGFKKEWNEDLSCYREKPLHNWAMHGYDAVETLARGVGVASVRSSSTRRRRRSGAMAR